VKIVPNIISIFRICLVPVFVAVYFADARDIKVYAIMVYALASVSDFLDGFLARKYQVSSNLGKLLDPLGDKLMTFAVILCMTIAGPIPIWAVVIIGFKEVLMAIGGYVVHKVAHVEIPPAKFIGKVSTVVFFLVCVSVMIFAIPGNMVIIMISGAILLMLLAFASYIQTYAIVMKNREKSR